MNELKVYLKEEVKSKEKETSETEKSDKTKTSDKTKSTYKSKKVQMTNLFQIQSGFRSVNIVSVINLRVEPRKMVYLENLLKTRQMNFIKHFSEFMDKFNVRVQPINLLIKFYYIHHIL